MTICSDKQYQFIVLFLYTSIIVIAALLYVQTKSWLGALVLFACCAPIVTAYWIAVGRRIVLDSNGIEVSFLWYKKKMPWMEMRIKKYFHVDRSSYGYRDPYTDGVEFCLKNIQRPKWIKPFQYAVLAHPISYIVFHFPVNVPQKVIYPPLYEVDKAILDRKLADWNVDMKYDGV